MRRGVEAVSGGLHGHREGREETAVLLACPKRLRDASDDIVAVEASGQHVGQVRAGPAQAPCALAQHRDDDHEAIGLHVL